MELRVTSLGETPLLEIQGDIDHSGCDEVEKALDKAISGGSNIVLIDLTAVDYLDSGGISALLSGARRLRQNGWLGLIGPNDNVRRLLEIVGFFLDPTFRPFDDRASAEAAVARM